MKSKSLNSLFSATASQAMRASVILFVSSLAANAATFLWDGGGADNKFSTNENWNPDGPVTVNGNDIRFGPSSQSTADVNVSGNFNTLFFNSDAPAMTVSATTSISSMQFATSATTQIQNNSANPQALPAVVRAFWIGGSATRVWDAASGNLNFQEVRLRADSSVANSVTLNFSGSANHNVSGPINLENSWTGKTAGIAKSGSGTLTVSGGGNYNGTTSANGGNFVLDLVTAANIPATSPLSLGGGTFTLKGAPSGSSAQTVASIGGTTGNVVINPNGGSDTKLTITSAVIPAGTTVNFDTSAGTPSTAIVAWNPTLTNGFIGAGYTIKDNTGFGLATVTAGNITRLSSTVLTASNPTNSATDFLENTSVTNTVLDAQLNSLLVDTTSGVTTWDLASGNVATINSGIISVVGVNNYTISNGTLKSNTATNSDLILQNGGTGSFTISSPIVNGIGASTVTKTGPGTVVLSGANTYTGSTNVSGGTLILSGTTTTSQVAFNGGNGAIARVIAPAAAGTGLIKFNTGATNGVLQLHIDGGGTIAMPNALGGNTSITGNIDVDNNGSGTGGVVQLNGSLGTSAVGAMTFNVTGANGYSLYIAGLRSTAGGGGAVTLNPTTASLTVGSMTGSVAGKTSTWTLLGTDANSSVTGVISNGGGLDGGGIPTISAVQKSNSGTWTLSGANTYTGKSQIYNGTLIVSSLNSVVGGSANSNLGAPLTVALGTIDIGSAGTTGNLNYTGTGETTDRVINLGGSTGGAILTQSGAGLLKFTSDFTATGIRSKTLTLNGSTGGTGEVGGDIVNNATGQTQNTVAYTSAATTMTLSSVQGIVIGATISGTGIPAATTITAINTTTSVVTLSNATTAAGATFQVLTIPGVINPTSLTKNGTGAWTLSGAPTYTGATTVQNGTLTLSGNRTVNSGGINLNGTAESPTLNIQNGFYSLGGSFVIGQSGNTAVVNHSAGTITANAASRVLLGNGNSTTTYNLSGGTLISNGPGIRMGVNPAPVANTNNFVLSGTGQLTSSLQLGRTDAIGSINTTNIFSQTAGTATLTDLGIGGAAGDALIATNVVATLNLTGGAFTATNFTSLSAAGGVNSSISIGGTAAVTLPAFPTGRAVSPVAIGTGSSATITFDGGTLIPAATDPTYMSGLTHAFLTANGAKFDTNGLDITIDQTLENAPSAVGTLTKSGTGTLTLTGSNTYTGATTVMAGVLAVDGDSIANTGKLDIAGGKVLIPAATNEVVATLFFNGVAQPAGVYGSSSSGAPLANRNDTYFDVTGSGTLTVDPSAASYATFISGTFAGGATVPLGQRGPNDDPDKDGNSNLIEYAIAGFDPTASNPSPGSLVGNTLTFTKRLPLATDIVYSIQESTDLGQSDSWAPISPAATNGPTTISATLTTGLGKEFARLHISQP